MRNNKLESPNLNQRTFCVSYCRVSSDEQYKEGYSISSQFKLIQKYSEELSIRIDEEFIDIETAKKSGRTNFTKMVRKFKSLNKNHKDSCRLIIFCEKTDRLYRNIKDWVTLDELNNLEIHFVKEGTIISEHSKSSDMFIHGIKILVSKNYIDVLGEETRKGLNEKAEQGYFPMGAPQGYSNVRVNDKNIIEPNSNAPIVTSIFKTYALGNHSLSSLYKGIVEQNSLLNRNGKIISRATLHNILRNPFYYGVFKWKGQKHLGKHKAIITKELFETVQELLSKGNMNHPKTHTKEWLYQGLISCEICGSSYTMEIKKKRYVYYHCTGSKKACSKVYVREERIEEQVREQLKNITLPDELYPIVVKALSDNHKSMDLYHNTKRMEYDYRYEQIQEKLKLLYDDRLEKRISLDFYTDTAHQLRFEQDEITAKISRLAQANRNYYDLGIKIIELAQNATMTYSKANLSQKHEFLKLLLSNSVFSDGKLTLKWRQPFDLLPLMSEEWAVKKKGQGADLTPCPIKLP